MIGLQDSSLVIRRRWICRLAAFCAMLAAGMAFRSDYLTDWDSWDYAAQALCRHSSDLLLGRWWFVAAMRAAWLAGQWAFGLDRLEGYLAMQAAASLIMAGAVVAGMAWTYRLTRSAAAELLFATLVVTGLMVGIYASAVMTEGATLLTVTLAFLAWEAAVGAKRRPALWALAGGLSFGVAVDIREPAVLLAAWPIVSCLVDRPPRRWMLLGLAAIGAAATLGAGVLGAWAWFPWTDRTYFQNIIQWTGWMSAERSQFGAPILENLRFLAAYSFAACPAALLMALPALAWAGMRRRRLLWLAASLAPYAASLALNHDLSVNPRFVIPLVWLLSPMIVAGLDAALVAARRPARLRLAGAAVLGAGINLLALGWGWQMLNDYYLDYTESQGRTYQAMRRLPADAVVIPGPGTGVARYLDRIGQTRFIVIGSGWDWPGDKLKPLIDRYLAEGKRVYANLDERDWLNTARKSPEWDQLRSLARNYALAAAQRPMIELRQAEPRKKERPHSRPASNPLP